MKGREKRRLGPGCAHRRAPRRGRLPECSNLLMRRVVGAGLLLGVSALLLGVVGSARVAPTTILAWVGLRLLVGRARLPLRLLVGRGALPAERTFRFAGTLCRRVVPHEAGDLFSG